MESYTTSNGHRLTLGMFVESAAYGEAGTLIEFAQRASRGHRPSQLVWCGRVEFKTGALVGAHEWEQCELLYPVPTPTEVLDSMSELQLIRSF